MSASTKQRFNEDKFNFIWSHCFKGSLKLGQIMENLMLDVLVRSYGFQEQIIWRQKICKFFSLSTIIFLLIIILLML